MSDVKFVPADAYNGSPVVPTGNPMIDGVGPASWNPHRRDEPDVTYDGRPKLVAMRADAAFSVAKGDPDPRGLPVVAADKVVAGTVVDMWVNRSEPQVAYYEVQLSASERRVLLPSGYVQWPNFGLWGNDKLLVKAITAAQFANVPGTAREDRITLLEEDRICAYYAGGHLYSTPSRSQPLI
jgi:photosynthetic reaction center H subunit